jgi:hypothetical protein
MDSSKIVPMEPSQSIRRRFDEQTCRDAAIIHGRRDTAALTRTFVNAKNHERWQRRKGNAMRRFLGSRIGEELDFAEGQIQASGNF